MKLFIEMTLQSDAVFGNGLSMPGGEDIATQMDDQGFPYLKGNTLKGLFREELINLLAWKKAEQEKKASFTYLYRITFQERAVKDGMTMFTPYYNDIEDVLGVDATVTSSPILTQIDGTLSCGGATPYELTFRLVYRIATRIVA